MTRQNTLPGMPGPYHADPRRRWRHRGPWRPPAKIPCTYTAENGLRCELESIVALCNNSDREWHTHPPGVACGANLPIFNRCVLHSKKGV